ncbi:hypothetical protein GGI20_003388 [Coemansia sp. BCRC 34301]|nr:hypothetical protein GGI20_003388 [Coemansia sp. BCRC 34301]
MNITCAAFDTLPVLTYDNVAPQALQQVVIAFKAGTSGQVLDSFRDALQCRGSTVDPANYNTLTLTGFTSLALAAGVQRSKTVEAVEVNGMVTTLHTVPTSSFTRASPSSSPLGSATTGSHGSGASSRPVVNPDFGLDLSGFAVGASIAVQLGMTMAGFLATM